LKIKVATVAITPLHMLRITISPRIEYIGYCSIISEAFLQNILISLYPSRGKIGIRLKTARAIFKYENVIQKLFMGSTLFMKISVKAIQPILEYINITNIPTIAKRIFIVGHANDVISSPLTGCL